MDRSCWLAVISQISGVWVSCAAFICGGLNFAGLAYRSLVVCLNSVRLCLCCCFGDLLILVVYMLGFL